MEPWRLACPDWAARLKAGRTLVPDLPIDRKAGDRAVAILNKLRLADVPGTPTFGDAGGDWFRDVVRALFGSLDPETRQRMIRELLLLVPKKNSKTTNGALMMLTALLLNERPHASLIMTAPVQDVAQLAFDAAAGAIRLDPVLEKRLHIREHLKTIVDRQTKAELQIMSFDPAALTGQKPVAVLIDELHVVAKMTKAASAIRQLRGGMLPFPEAFLAFITTQSEEPPAGVFADELLKAREIRDGKREGAMLPVLYEFPEEMQGESGEWREPGNWPMVTPNAGRSISISRLVEEAETAERTSAAEFRAWASQHLNVQIGLALHASRWTGADFWLQADGGVTFDDLLTKCDVVVAGVDGGGLDDLLSLSLVGREEETKRWLHWGHSWAHPIVLDRRKDQAPRFRDFQNDGDLTIIAEGTDDDVQELADWLKRVEDAGLLGDIGVDQAGIGAIVDAITERGIKLERVIGVPQGWKLQGAILTTERKLSEGNLVHGGSRLMAYAVGNARAEPRGNAIAITKATATGKIDPLMSLFDAAALMALNPKPRKRQYQMFFA